MRWCSFEWEVEGQEEKMRCIRPVHVDDDDHVDVNGNPSPAVQ